MSFFTNMVLSGVKPFKLISIMLLVIAFMVPSHAWGEETFGKMYRSRVVQLTSMLKMHYPDLNMTILDVGANTGAWSDMMKSYFKNANIFMIEGNDDLEVRLKQTPYPYEICLVGNEQKSVDFYVHRKFSTGGSVFKEESYKLFEKDRRTRRYITKKTLPMDRIDNIIRRRNVGQVDFLKMDVQGAEFIALQGATETLKTAHMVLLEASVHQYNRGAPSFGDINIFMEQRGFRMYDLIDVRYDAVMLDKTTGQKMKPEEDRSLVQIDVLWVRADSPLFTASMFPPPPPAKYTCSEAVSPTP